MVLTFLRTAAIALSLALLGIAAPAVPHENHQREQLEETEKALTPAPGTTPGAMEERMEDHMEAMEDAQPKTWPERLISWAGRMHPFAVYFPIALIPISWLALIIARRRGDTVDLIRAFIIVAGVAALGAAALDWLDAGFALTDRNPIQAVHRWIGTGIGLIGAVIAIWAWRRASSVNSRFMVWTLGIMTLVLLIQGWFGGAITHGVSHMMI